MKKLIFVVVFACFYLFSVGQEKGIGVFLGTSYYNGDLNKFIPFNPPAPAFGIMYTHDMSVKSTMRIYANRGSLSGKAKDTIGTDFKTTFYDLGFMFEINAKNFSYSGYNVTRLSPFFEVGAAVLYAPTTSNPIVFSIPIGVGIKYAMSRKSILAFEWNYHLTGSDFLDLYSPEEANSSTILNNDWYSFLGVVYRYKLFSVDRLCPAYR